MPVNALIIRALLRYYSYYGDNVRIECPTGSDNLMDLYEVAREIADRLTRIFLRYGEGRHRAGLNLGDCAVYALAGSRNLPLL